MTTSKKRLVKAVSAAVDTRQELRGFYDGAGQFPNFAFVKHYWTGKGARGRIAPRIEKKLTPGSGIDGEPSDLKAAKSELLVPAFAPETYADLGLCLHSYDCSFSAAETNAYVQLTFSFPEAMNLHHCYEMVRAFVRAEIVDAPERNLPVVLILHKPQEAGSVNDPHIHAIVLLRRVNQLGWATYEKHLPTEEGNLDIYEAWLTFRDRWNEEWPAALHAMPM